jgi:type I restriction enzyme M protein
LRVWYEGNLEDIDRFEALMRRKVHCVIKPRYLWSGIAEMARVQDE